jgi:acyl-CoA synthetase (AMP-forming)/AMP-acid ligase II
VSQAPYAPALIVDDRQLSYAELGRAVAGLARRLEALGVRRRRVATLLPNSIEAVVSALAVLAVGAQLAPINPFFKAPELEVALGEAEPALLIASSASSIWRRGSRTSPPIRRLSSYRTLTTSRS